MSDEHQSLGSNEKSEKKPFLQSLFGGLFQNEIKTRDDLVEVIRGSVENALIDSETKEMIEGVMEISELRVRDVMIPRPQIISLEPQATLQTCVDTVIDSSHSRFPIFSDDGSDTVLGILLAKDLLKYLSADSDAFEISTILRPAVVVPESKRIDRMLKEFRAGRFHMAIVADEFGAVSGLITIEDILEQIVGNIEDEFDEEEIEPIRPISTNIYAVSALTDIEKFNHRFSTEFTDEEVDTVGGLVMQAFGYLPKRGEQIELDGVHFKVISADSRRLLQLRVTLSDERLIQMERIKTAKAEQTTALEEA